MRLPRLHCRLPIADCRLSRRLADLATSSSPVTRHPSLSQRGVALVITVVLLSVILFLTVAFLALMGREKGAVKTSIDQTTARLGAESALERAKAEIIASILNTSNTATFDLLVSTNFINWRGFDPAAQGTVNPETNVNFDYDLIGSPLTALQALQNLTNLLYSPRVPVYITNRTVANSVDFRYYLDLNRDRRHNRTGLWPATNALGGYFTTNGALTPLFAPPNVLSNFFVGDPEWIGGLDRPDKPHGPENKFLYRYAYIVVPEGKTLDVNFIHNQSATRALNPVNDGFFRNQGVAPWEMNLAAFLVDLNTNVWNPDGSKYDYRLPTTGLGNLGVAFEDAQAILRHRYANNYNTLAAGYPAFLTNLVDEYNDGNWLITPTNLPPENDVAGPWVGSDNTNRYFTIQDLFDPTKTKILPAPIGFPDRLNFLSTSNSTYDQYTYYRMLAQLGTDSAPEDPDKLNLNYVNVGGLSATNLIRWTDTAAIQSYFGAGVNPAVLFFTNVVDRLLGKYTAEWLAADFNVYTNLFKTTNTFGVTNIPVYVSNQFIYPPAVHRVLQVAANIWDAQARKGDALGELPTVFRPQFRVANGNVYIGNFVEETTAASVQANTGGYPIIDLYGQTNAAGLLPVDGNGNANVLIFGVPLVVGAKKGLPNFNEFSTESSFLITRKMELVKNARGGAERIYQTNQFFTMSLTMPSGAEFWNSYASNFNRKVFIYVTNRTTMFLTNDSGVALSRTFITGGFVSDPKLGTSYWPAYQEGVNNESFVVTMRTNVPFLSLTGYLPSVAGNAGFINATNQAVFDKDQSILAPRWGVSITNRIHAMIVEQGTDRILDYVLLGDLTSYRDLTGEFSQAPAADPFQSLWATNTNPTYPARLSGRVGAMQQVRISRGEYNYPSQDWRGFGSFVNNNVASEIAKFRAFFEPNGIASFDGKLGTNNTLRAIVPFSPSVHISMPMLWQANDPLVHYISGELLNIAESGQPKPIKPPGSSDTNQLVNIGKKNKRYQPWGKEPGALDTDPDAFNSSLKDPLVRSSDAWQFPTNVLPTVGWLGRIHRGTPWQTIYLKASNVGLTNIVKSPSEWVGNAAYRKSAEKWAQWTGNKTLEEGFYTRPVADRLLFEVFTTSLNDNSARGRLSVNQTNLAAWSALFSGMTVLTNTSTETALSIGLPPVYDPLLIQPAGIYDAANATTWPPLVRMVSGINAMRANTNFFPNATFATIGDILAVPELTDASPFLNQSTVFAQTRGVDEVAYEWLPQQALSLLQAGPPRFVVYAYGQSLSPAPESIVTTGGPAFGLCTNYAITAEVALRAVVRIEGSPDRRDENHPDVKKRYPPRVVVESFNYLPPE